MENIGDIQYIWCYDSIGKAIFIAYLFNRQVAGKFGTCYCCGGGRDLILFNAFIYRNLAGIYS